MYNIDEDIRLNEADTIIRSFASTNILESTKALILEDNTLVFTVDDTLLYITKLKSDIILPNVGFRYSKEHDVKCDMIIDNRVLSSMIVMYNMYMLDINNSPAIANIDNCSSNENIMNMINAKAGTPLQYYRLITYNHGTCLVPIFPGLIKLNKGDDLSIIVKDLGNGFLLTDNILYKKKLSRDIHMYYKMMKLI